MAYGKEVYAAALAKLNANRRRAEENNTRLKASLYEKLPRLRQIEEELAETGIGAARLALSSSQDTGMLFERLRCQNLALQAERAELLTVNGLAQDILETKYGCRVCRDTGYHDGRLCDCFRALLREEAYRCANSGSPLPLTTFESFDLSYYPTEKLNHYGFSPRTQMRDVLNFCRQYAADITKSRESLLLIGPTGLGKTHLALAIAGSAIAQGRGVVYDTAQNIFTRFEDEYFGRREKSYTFSVLDCDLLVMDDLGSEFTSPFSVTVLYNIINTRTLSRRPMIVSTNLTPEELTPRYNDRIVSRLIGEFHMLMFFGTDIRQMKLKGDNPRQNRPAQ
ncbi:MAG: ATP-binding protein [Clostridia bacterium]|nr:ATP-binding protein [Clostridia bacterium]MDR3645279.1 ATP-binding protein [Clostridia bacterium]